MPLNFESFGADPRAQQGLQLLGGAHIDHMGPRALVGNIIFAVHPQHGTVQMVIAVASGPATQVLEAVFRQINTLADPGGPVPFDRVKVTLEVLPDPNIGHPAADEELAELRRMVKLPDKRRGRKRRADDGSEKA